MEQKFKIVYQIKNLNKSIYGKIPGLKKLMCEELFRVYNDYYVDMCNSSEVTESLNKEFHSLYPDYFEKNKGKDVWDLTEYNNFMRNGYEDRVCKKLNQMHASHYLDFKIGDELNLVGYFKRDPELEVQFFLKEV